LWLGLIAKNFYARQMGGLMAEQVNWPAAIIFYLIYIAGILLFVVFPSLEKESLFQAALYGALFGLVCYATYDLTNLATMKGFPIKMVVVDLIWGIVLTGSVSVAGFFIARFIR
jgi:uncharacterized membrane protein